MEERRAAQRVTDVRPVLEEIRRRLVSCFHPERIILFGSHATRRAGPDSDVDLLIVMPFVGRHFDQALAIRQLLRGVGAAKDIVVLRPQEFAAQRDVPGSIAYPAAHEGISLDAA